MEDPKQETRLVAVLADTTPAKIELETEAGTRAKPTDYNRLFSESQQK
jgi:hypothetical protein